MKGLSQFTRPDGSVVYQLRYTDPLTNKTKKISKTMPCHSVRNQRAAEAYLQDKLDGILNDRKDGALLADVISDYISDMSMTWRASTKNRNEATLTRILRAFPDGTILSCITAQKWRESLSALSHGSAGTYNEYLKRVKAFLRWCVGNDYLDSNICDKLTRKPEPKDGAEDRATDKYLEPAEASLLLTELEPMARWHQIAKFMILSGLRCGEALALTDLDVGSEYIRVTKTIDAKTMQIGPPKTPKSLRDVAITKELASCIAEIRRYNAWIKSAYHIESPLFFFSEKGEHIKYYSFNNYLSNLARRILGKNVTSHWLRHTHASFLLAAGVPIEVISRRLGHESTAITQRVYLHIIDKLKKKDAELLSDVNILGERPQVIALSESRKDGTFGG